MEFLILLYVFMEYAEDCNGEEKKWGEVKWSEVKEKERKICHQYHIIVSIKKMYPSTITHISVVKQ